MGEGKKGGEERREGRGKEQKKENTLSCLERRTGQSLFLSYQVVALQPYRLFSDAKQQPDLSFAIAAIFSTLL